MELQGFVVVALTLILLGYLLPHLVRSRQLALDCRVEDRFSGDLRILATGASRPVTVNRPGDAGQHLRPSARPFLHDPTRRPEAPMNRPGARSERTDDARALAAARAARAARVARRAAAARRRLALTVVLLVATAAGWAGTALAGTTWVLGAVPAALLVTVLVLGRRTAVKAAAHDKRDRAEMARLEARLRALPRRSGQPAARSGQPANRSGQPAVPTGLPAVASDVRSEAGAPGGAAAAAPGSPAPAGSPTTDRTAYAPAAPAAEDMVEVTPVGEVTGVVEVDAAVREAGPAEVVGATLDDEETIEHDVEPDVEPGDDARGGPWTPVPLPAPAYTLKPSAPRRDVAPYSAPAQPVATSAAAAQPVPSVATESPAALDLDAVLARRRAAGE